MFLVYEKLETQYLIQHHIQLLWGLQKSVILSYTLESPKSDTVNRLCKVK